METNIAVALDQKRADDAKHLLQWPPVDDPFRPARNWEAFARYALGFLDWRGEELRPVLDVADAFRIASLAAELRERHAPPE